jgi:hypothetical protein
VSLFKIAGLHEKLNRDREGALPPAAFVVALPCGRGSVLLFSYLRLSAFISGSDH